MNDIRRVTVVTVLLPFCYRFLAGVFSEFINNIIYIHIFIYICYRCTVFYIPPLVCARGMPFTYIRLCCLKSPTVGGGGLKKAV